jgi:5-methylcytosine-specific restriction endonuclease McrA
MENTNADVKATGFYQSKRWKLTAQRIRQRDDYICQKCKCLVKHKQHAVHHIVELTIMNYKNEDIAFNENNLILLCNSCHRQEHSNSIDPIEIRKQRENRYFKK